MVPFSSSFRMVLALITAIAVFSGCNQTDIAISNPVPDCYDGIQNQGEVNVDCGGPCAPCPAKVTANIDGVPWSSEGNVTTQINSNSIIILSGNGTSALSMIHTGPFTEGTFALQSAIYTINATNTNYISSQGSITFSQWNEQAGQLFGSFNFTAFESSGSGDTIQVTAGKLEFIPYQP